MPREHYLARPISPLSLPVAVHNNFTFPYPVMPTTSANPTAYTPSPLTEEPPTRLNHPTPRARTERTRTGIIPIMLDLTAEPSHMRPNTTVCTQPSSSILPTAASVAPPTTISLPFETYTAIHESHQLTLSQLTILQAKLKKVTTERDILASKNERLLKRLEKAQARASRVFGDDQDDGHETSWAEISGQFDRVLGILDELKVVTETSVLTTPSRQKK